MSDNPHAGAMSAAAQARWDARRIRTKGAPVVPRNRPGMNRCLWCHADPYPRIFYCSDECSAASRAETSAKLIDSKGKR